MSSAEVIIHKLDLLCAQSLWPEVLTLAAETPASSARNCALAVQVASAEAALEAELSGCSDPLDISSVPRKTVKTLLQKVKDIVVPTSTDNFTDLVTMTAYHLLHAHLLYLRSEFRQCLNALERANNLLSCDTLKQQWAAAVGCTPSKSQSPLDSSEAPGFDSLYHKALTVKQRALGTAAWKALDNRETARENAATLVILDQTLKSVPEAARWAQTLRALEIKLSEAGSPEHFQALEKYANVCTVSGRPPSNELKSELDALDTIGELGAPSTASEAGSIRGARVRATKQTAGHRVASQPKTATNGLSRSFTRHLHLPLMSHRSVRDKSSIPFEVAARSDSAGEHKQITFEHQMKVCDEIEASINKKMDEWKSQVRFDEPNRPLTSPSDIELTKSLAADIVAAIEETFNSTSLMRQLVEVFLAMGRYTEALAAFDTYVSYQRIQLMRLRAGGPSIRPDNPFKIAEIFSAVLQVIVSSDSFVSDTYLRVDMVSKLYDQLEKVWPTEEEDPESAKAVGHVYALKGAIFAFQGIRSEGDDYFKNRMEKAMEHYELAFAKWDGSGLACYSYGQLLAYNYGPARAYKFVKESVVKYETVLHLWHLMALLLTAQQRYDETIEICEGIIASTEQRGFETLSSSNKKCILNIKMTQIAAIEAKFGVELALDELPYAMELLAGLWPTQTAMSSPDFDSASVYSVSQTSVVAPQTSAPSVQRTQSHRSILTEATHSNAVAALRFRLARTHLTNSYGDEAETRSQAPSDRIHVRLDVVSRAIISEFWLWIGQLYIRAGLVDDAQLAVQQAISINGHDANTYVVTAQSLAETDPRKSWSKLSTALTFDIFSVGAIIGRASLLEKYGRVKNGSIVPGSSEPSVLFQSDVGEVEAYRICLGQLEEICTRNPGRFVPETWYFIGILCEALGDKASARKAFWHCVELEEQSGLRVYTTNLLLW